MSEPDYVYDPEAWEFTAEWGDRDFLTEDMHGELWKPKKFKTLINGPDRFAVEVALSTDDNGDPDETEIQWFDTLEEAQAAAFKRKD